MGGGSNSAFVVKSPPPHLSILSRKEEKKKDAPVMNRFTPPPVHSPKPEQFAMSFPQTPVSSEPVPNALHAPNR